MTDAWPGRVLVVVPTYDERDNLEWIVGRLRAAVPHVDVLVVDDDSPDGTGDLADRLAALDGTVRVSSPSGGPTLVTLEVPCSSSSPRTTPSSGTA